MEVPAFKEGFDAQDGLPVLAQNPDIDAGCVSGGAHDEEPSVTSPEEFRDSRISDNYNEVALPLARFRRSKSRQRALELRNSAQATKPNPCEENGFDACAYGVTPTSDNVKELEFVKPVGGFIEHRTTEEVNVGEHGKNNIDVCAGQSMKELEHVGAFEATKSVNASREIFARGKKRKKSGGDKDTGKSSGSINEYEHELMNYVGKSPQLPDHAGEFTDLINLPIFN